MLKQEKVKEHYNNIMTHKEKLKEPSLLRRSLVEFL